MGKITTVNLSHENIFFFSGAIGFYAYLIWYRLRTKARRRLFEHALRDPQIAADPRAVTVKIFYKRLDDLCLVAFVLAVVNTMPLFMPPTGILAALQLISMLATSIFLLRWAHLIDQIRTLRKKTTGTEERSSDQQ
jgi:hypothetical protein